MSRFIIDLNSGTKHEQFLYPAGEMQVRIKPNFFKEIEAADRLTIVARISNTSHIIELLLLIETLQHLAPAKRTQVILPYLPYGRADRRFVKGDCFGLMAFSNMLDSYDIELYSLDIHSLHPIIQPMNIGPEYYIEKAIWAHCSVFSQSKFFNILFPDKGAAERYHIPDELGGNLVTLKLNKLYATKVRDAATGKLLMFELPPAGDFVQNAPTLIVDDICDGGGTFIGIAKEAASRSYGLDLGLYVTHGIFSKGFTELNEHFRRVYSTNSFIGQEEGRAKLTRYDADHYLLGLT